MEIDQKEKLDQLRRILHSRTLHGCENLKSFLNFVVINSLDDNGDHLKEYTIATEVFGRSDDFSPRSDSVVRVQASRLRLKLQEYYSTEGKTDRVLIELPKGHYNPAFSVIDSRTLDSLSASVLSETNGGSGAGLGTIEQTGPRSSQRSTALLYGVIVVLLIAVFALAGWNLSLRQQTR